MNGIIYAFHVDPVERSEKYKSFAHQYLESSASSFLPCLPATYNGWSQKDTNSIVALMKKNGL